MKRLKTLFFTLLNLFCVYGMAFAQYRSSDSTGLAACGACGGGFLFFIIAIAVINIAILVWVARDCKARGMGSSLGWMILVFFTSFLGLIIYFFARPKGELEVCSNCKNKRLKAMVKCPHCGV